MGFEELISKNILICDGAMGTMTQQMGLNPGPVPEMLNFTVPNSIFEIHKSYFEAGSDLVLTNTFGANRIKLASCGKTPAEVITRAVSIAKKAACGFDEKKYVALDIAPVGTLMEPAGTMKFNEAYELYKEQVIAGAEAGADLVVLETFSDIYELKAGILAAKENSILPVIASVTFQENGRMLMGSDVKTAVNILNDLQADAIGINCSLGPEEMLPLVKQFLSLSKGPVLIKPNAGLPKVVDGEVVYQVDIPQFCNAMDAMIQEGVWAIGGCCGTNPEYIRELKALKERYDCRIKPQWAPFTAASSAMQTVSFEDKPIIIGGGISLDKNNELFQSIKSGDVSAVEEEAWDQTDEGAEIIYIGGISAVKTELGLEQEQSSETSTLTEEALLAEIVSKVTASGRAPLMIESADARALEAAAACYSGKPVLGRITADNSIMDAMFAIVKRFGTLAAVKPVDGRGIPGGVDDQLKVSRQILEKAAEYGVGSERIFVDCGFGHDSPALIRRIKSELKARTFIEADMEQENLLQECIEAGVEGIISMGGLERLADILDGR